MKSLVRLPFLAVALAVAAPAVAQPDGEVTYVIQKGDTLYDLARKYLSDHQAMSDIRSSNGIRAPRRLQIGDQIVMPRAALRFEPVGLELASFTGRVTVDGPTGPTDAAQGLGLSEGAVISTGPKSFASISGDDNTIITLPSNSRIQIIDARRYTINDKIDVRIKVLKGRGTIRAPKIEGDARFRAGTPLAVTAVRGTEFRVGYRDDADLSLTEVVEGEVAVSQEEQALLATAGFGVAGAADGLKEPEALLPPPAITDGSELKTRETVSFAIDEVSGATTYRTQIARDAGFIEIIDEQVSAKPEVIFEQLSDGRYFVRARAVAPSGLEGLAKAYNFRRKRVGSDAGQESSPLADTLKFAWRPQGEGQSYNAFQLWRADDPSRLIVDEVGMTHSALLIGAVEPGTYVWRVATFQIDEGEIIKVWGPAQEIELTQ